jgi:hypothetical protein
VQAHPALHRFAVLLAVPAPAMVPAPAVMPAPAGVPAPAVVPAPGFLLRVAVPVHVDDVYLAQVRLLTVAKARETPEQIKVKPQSSYEYP